MIKPETLWHLFRDCKDSKYIGDICRALGEQDTELDYGQKQIVSIVQRDSEAMDKSMEKKRVTWRNKKRTQRKSTNSEDLDKGGQSAKCAETEGEKPCPPMSPSSLSPSLSPSLPPSHPSSDTYVSSDVCAASQQHTTRAGEDAADAATHTEIKPQIPSRSDMELFAREQGIPLDYIDTFLGEIKATGYTFMGRNGTSVPVTLRNFRTVLGQFWKQNQRNIARDAKFDAAYSRMKHADNWIGSRPDQLENEPI